MANGIDIIEQERVRQITEEGYTLEHDVHHPMEELARAASCYAMPEGMRLMMAKRNIPWGWPMDWTFKPTPEDRIKELAKAGALIVAEIERLQNT